MIGIYKITNPKGRVYIGQSINVERRKYSYQSCNCKKQIRLYNSILKYGWINHKFEILCECEISELNEKERYYQDLYLTIGANGLNCVLTKTDDRSGYFSGETKLKVKKTRKIKRDLKILKSKNDFDNMYETIIVLSKEEASEKIKKIQKQLKDVKTADLIGITRQTLYVRLKNNNWKLNEISLINSIKL